MIPITTPNEARLVLDKVERKIIAEIRSMKPEYASLELRDVARMELRNHLFQERRRLINKLNSPDNDGLVLWTGYKIISDISLYATIIEQQISDSIENLSRIVRKTLRVCAKTSTEEDYLNGNMHNKTT